MPLTPADLEQFRRDGFLHCQGCLEPPEVLALGAAIADVLAGPRNEDFLLGADGVVVRKVAYVFDKHPIFLLTLAHPNILGLALSLSPSPEELVLTWEDLLVKPAFVGITVPVHQDLALQFGKGCVFSLGLHVDDSRANPVWFLPGSHRLGPLTRDQIRRLHTERRSEFVPVAARAGDVVVHDVLTAHFSEANTARSPRHTWYLEFRTVSQLLDGPWSCEWIDRRQALLLCAVEARAQLGLPTIDVVLKGRERLGGYVAAPELRIPHVGGAVQYDTTSPFYHFD